MQLKLNFYLANRGINDSLKMFLIFINIKSSYTVSYFYNGLAGLSKSIFIFLT